MTLGIHASIRAGYPAALETARALGCRALQIFGYRRHHEPSPEELSGFREGARAHGLRVIAHTRYVPFLGSRDAERHGHSVSLLRRELELAAALGAEGLILHAGAYAVGEDREKGLARVAEGVLRSLAAGGSTVPVVLENVPGGGRRLGGPLEDLAELGAMLDRRRVPVGFCLDTAHAWAQGYDLSTSVAVWRFTARVNRLLGADRVKAFHLNDSRAVLGSHREHHWHWGRGYLGLEGLKALLARSEFAEALGILETPYGADRENLDVVRALLPVTA
ncbi:MAG: deoxyribonuclease IV [Elusimicrobia bacterium]|nr:deoxyribonuclease IV [Elusimicrobiota bacterium]